MWIDTNRSVHMVTFDLDDEHGFDTKECGDIKQDSRAASLVVKKKKMLRDTHGSVPMVTYDDDDDDDVDDESFEESVYDSKECGDIKQVLVDPKTEFSNKGW